MVARSRLLTGRRKFLSIQAQDFIEEFQAQAAWKAWYPKFLSIQAQDFIEESRGVMRGSSLWKFLSIQAQDFIEERSSLDGRGATCARIPEHSSSGLH